MANLLEEVKSLQLQVSKLETTARQRLEVLLEAEGDNTRLRNRIVKLESIKQQLLDRLATIEKGK